MPKPKRPDTPFGKLMRAGLKRTGISQGKLGGRISDFTHGPIYDASAVRMLMTGERRLNHRIVAQIIDILDLDWAEAWAASGLLPPGVSAPDLEIIQAHRQRRRSDRELEAAALPTTALLYRVNGRNGDWPIRSGLAQARRAAA